MTHKTESQILAGVFEDVRNLTKFYIARAEEVDPHRVFIVEDKKLNSLYWLVGHLVWAEHYLLVEAMTGERMDIPWIEKFDNGITESDPELPSIDELSAAMEKVHERAMTILHGMEDTSLDEPNRANLTFRAGNSRRTVIHHAIRHEPCHTGQIGWLIKMSGLETI